MPNIYGYDDDEYDDPVHRSKNFNAPKGVHIMNKAESKALRQLQSKTGLTEEELRMEKKNRKILSEAQKAKGDKDDADRAILRFMKSILSELKLPVEHPDVKQAINKELNSDSYLYRKLRGGFSPLSGKFVILRYIAIRKEQKKKDGKGKS